MEPPAPNQNQQQMPFSLLLLQSGRNLSSSNPLSLSDTTQLTIFMDSPEFPSGKSPRRELQGPRPTPLKVRKDSHKIRKPPVPPPATAQQFLPPTQPRQPVIIYTVSPKIIHADPSEFMNLVQRLTGASSSTVTPPNSFPQFHETGEISPAARFASTEKTKLSPEKMKYWNHDLTHQEQEQEQGIMFFDHRTNNNTGTLFPGILSPGPASLPPIPQKMFQSPASDPNPFNTMFNDFSPMLGGSSNSNFMIPSPSNYFLSPKFASPTTATTPSLDIFNNFFDL